MADPVTPGFWRQAWIVGSTDLGRRIRDRSALIAAIAAPLALAVVFGSLFSSTAGSSFRIGVADADGGPTAAGIVEALLADDTGSEEEGGVIFVEVDPDEIADLVEDGDLAAAFRFEPGLGRPGGEITVVGHADRQVSTEIAASIAEGIAGRLDRVALALAAAPTVGLTPDDDLAERASATPGPMLTPAPLGGRTIDAMAFFGASMSMVLLFFTVGFAAQSLLEDRRLSVLDRLLAGPVRPAALLAGKVASVAVLALIGFGVVWGVTSLAFGAEWGDPASVAVLIVATVAAMAGVATFVASFATTPRQAETITSVVTFGLALLGGNFVGPAGTPEALQRLASFTPNGIALRAFTDVSADAASLGSIATALVSLVAFAAVFGTIGLTRLHRTVAP